MDDFTFTTVTPGLYDSWAYTVGADTASSTEGVTVTDNGTDTITLNVPQTPHSRRFARLKVAIAE